MHRHRIHVDDRYRSGLFREQWLASSDQPHSLVHPLGERRGEDANLSDTQGVPDGFRRADDSIVLACE